MAASRSKKGYGFSRLSYDTLGACIDVQRQLGLLVNFGEKPIGIERLVHTPELLQMDSRAGLDMTGSLVRYASEVKNDLGEV